MTKKKVPAAKVLLSLSKMTVAEKAALAQSVGAAFGANATTFPSPPVNGGALIAAGTALIQADAAAKAARQASLLATSKRDDAETAVDAVLGTAGEFVQLTSKGVASIISLATFALRGAPVRATTAPPAPDPLAASSGTKTGEAKLAWGKSAGAKGFIIEYTLNPTDPTSWKHLMSTATTKRKVVVTGVPSGRIWFHVAALGTQGQGAWSDPATCIVG